MKDELTKWVRNCPNCGKELTYSNKKNLKRANIANTPCFQCSIPKIKLARSKQVITPEHANAISESLTGRKRSKEECESISKGLTGILHSDEHKQKISKTKKGVPQTPKQIEARRKGLIGRKLSAETKRKIRVSYTEYLLLCGGKTGWKPTYNKSSIPIIEVLAIELGITDLQHAENGGEFYIKELGYWVDGYSVEKNIVIEYDEKHHFDKNGELYEKDKQRQLEIEEYLGCTFIRIKK